MRGGLCLLTAVDNIDSMTPENDLPRRTSSYNREGIVTAVPYISHVLSSVFSFSFFSLLGHLVRNAEGA